MRRLTCWAGLPPLVYLRRPAVRPPFPAQEPGVRLYAFARQGIWHGVQALGLQPGDAVLVPAYHHGSEIQALVAAGLRCVFYGTGDGVRPVPEELDALLAPGTRALYLVHTLGLPQDAFAWRRWCNERGLLLIEDAAQAWLATVRGQPVGSSADLAVFCAYKTVPVPEGAYVLARADVPAAQPNAQRGVPEIIRRHGAWLAQRSATVGSLAEVLGLTHTVDPEGELDLRLDKTGPWSTTQTLLRRLGDPSVAAVRRAHYRVLLDRLGDAVPAPFGELPNGSSPFVFPLAVEDKGTALARLASHGVHALDLWSTAHPSLPQGAFPQVDELRRTVVGLPVHQGLRLDELAVIAHAAGARRPDRRLHVERLPDLAAAEAPWRRLAAAAHPFASYEWAQAWHATDGRGAEPLIGLCRDATGREIALLALQRGRTARLRTLRFWAAEPADLTGPVCDPADAVAAAAGLRTLLASLPGWDLLLAERLPGEVAWPALLGAAAARREASPTLMFGPGGWQGYLAGRSANFRQQVRRRERQLRRRHDVAFRLSAADTLEADLEALFELHADRWPEGTDFLARRDFHAQFARLAAGRGWLRLWLLELDGVAVAAWYGLRHGGQEWYYQAGRDRRWDAAHVGSVLLAHSVRAAADDGVTAYHFLRGGEAYKHRFTVSDLGTDTVVLGRGAAGRAAALAAQAAGALPADVRQRLRAGLSPAGPGGASAAQQPCRPSTAVTVRSSTLTSSQSDQFSM